MEFNRRDFIKGTLALGSIAAVGGLAGCSSPQNQSPDSSPLADTGSIPGIPESFTDGKWIGTAMGHDDDLIVEVVVAGGDLASVRVLRCDDTIGIGTTAAPIMASRILETKNLDVDTVTGATTTSIAVRNAVADAITNAGGSGFLLQFGDNCCRPGAPLKTSRSMSHWPVRAPRDSSPPSVFWRPASRSCSSRNRTLPAARCR